MPRMVDRKMLTLCSVPWAAEESVKAPGDCTGTVESRSEAGTVVASLSCESRGADMPWPSLLALQ